MKAETVAILGLDRIGASVALAIREQGLDLTIVGYDGDDGVTREAQKRGIVDKAQWRLVNAAKAADILVLSLPAHELEKTLAVIGPVVPEHALVLDLGNMKGAGSRWAAQHLAQGHYVGAVAVLAAAQLDDGRYGLDAARADMFHNSVFCLMPAANADPRAVETAVALGRLLGAAPFFVDADEYDSLVQGIETLPGLLAAALFRAVTRSTGWRDSARLAGLPFALATAALRDEAEIPYLAFREQQATLQWLDAVLHELAEIRRYVSDNDRERLAALAEQLSADRDRWLHDRARNDWNDQELPGMNEVTSGFNFFGRLGQIGRRDADRT